MSMAFATETNREHDHRQITSEPHTNGAAVAAHFLDMIAALFISLDSFSQKKTPLIVRKAVPR